MMHFNYPSSSFLVRLYNGDDGIFSQMCCEDQERKPISTYFATYKGCERSELIKDVSG